MKKDFSDPHRTDRRTAFISDIHGNSLALAAVLDDIAGRDISAVYNLGDSLFGPVDPHGTFDLLVNSDIKHLMGNGDRALLLPDDGSSSTMNLVRGGLTSSERKWLAQLPSEIRTDRFTLFHGSPESDQEYLLEGLNSGGAYLKSLADLKTELSAIDTPVVVSGHSHVPRVVQLPGGPLVVNAGSVGLPAYKDDWPCWHKMESGSPQAKYVILEETDEGWLVEIVGVPYDWKEAARLADSQGRADWAQCLATGFAEV